MDVKTKQLGDISRSKVKQGSFDDGDSAATKGKDGYNGGVLQNVKTSKGNVPVNGNMIVDSAKKGSGGEVDKKLTRPNKLGLPED